MTQLLCEKPTLFKGRHFNHLLIIQAVRCYVTYKLSYRDMCDLMAERGVAVVHTTVLRWVQRFVPVSVPKISSGLEIVTVREIISHFALSSGSSFFRWFASHLWS